MSEITAENNHSHLHQIIDYQEGGGLKVRTPSGKEITYSPQQVAGRLTKEFGETIGQDIFISTAARLSTELQAVNRQQASDALRLMWAGVNIARNLDPNFDNQERTLEQKLADGRKVIDAAGGALITLEKYQTEAAQYDFIQTVLNTSAEYLAQGLFNTVLTPGAKGEMLEILRKTAALAVVMMAGRTPEDVMERGAANLKIAKDAVAEAGEAPKRAALVTQSEKLKVTQLKEGIGEAKRRAAIERDHLRNVRGQELRERKMEHLVGTTGGITSRAANWAKDTTKEIFHGARDFLLDSDEGLVVKISNTVGKAWSLVAENISTPTAAGIGFGGALGVTAGFKLGSGLVIALEGATLSSSLETAVFWLPTIFMGIGLSAAGGYAGRRLSMWVKDRYGNDEE